MLVCVCAQGAEINQKDVKQKPHLAVGRKLGNVEEILKKEDIEENLRPCGTRLMSGGPWRRGQTLAAAGAGLSRATCARERARVGKRRRARECGCE